MKNPKRAESLREVAAQTTNQPLSINDPRYVDVAEGRDTKDLKMLYLHLRDAGALEGTGAKDRKVFTTVALAGGRGCGKTTELFRIEAKLSDKFEPLHLFVDDSSVQDKNYNPLNLQLIMLNSKQAPGWQEYLGVPVSVVSRVVRSLAGKPVAGGVLGSGTNNSLNNPVHSERGFSLDGHDFSKPAV